MVTVEHIARVPVRHPDVVVAARHYGMTIRTWVPEDPRSQGGSEATVRVAEADLLGQYAGFAELEELTSGKHRRVVRAASTKPVITN